jgi:hypothetical protein
MISIASDLPDSTRSTTIPTSLCFSFSGMRIEDTENRAHVRVDYTPIFPNSKMFVEFFGCTVAGGDGGDTFNLNLYSTFTDVAEDGIIDSNSFDRIGQSRIEYVNSSGGGMRTGPGLPITGVYYNTNNTNAINFVLAGERIGTTNDDLTLRGNFLTVKITEHYYI